MAPPPTSSSQATSPEPSKLATTEKLLAEFIGTFLLVLTVGCNVLTGSPVWGVTSIACTLMVMVYALGLVSGAHFNPAVTLALWWHDKNEMRLKIVKYIAAQIAGGIAAGLLYSSMAWKVFNLAPAVGFGWVQAFFAEAIYTFMLCFVVLNVAASKWSERRGTGYFYGLAIGFVIVAGGYGAGHISGRCFNPAVAIAIDVVSWKLGFGWCIAYTIFECIGAILAVELFHQVRPEERKPEDDPPQPNESYKIGSRLLSEFLGTYMLVLTVGLNVLGESKAPVWSIAASLMCMIFALGTVSGAHFNPAVTIAILFSGDETVQDDGRKVRAVLKTSDVYQYVSVQLIGGFLAAVTYCLMENNRTFPLQPGAGHTWLSAYLAEFIFTFLLAYVVLSVATVREAWCDQVFGLAIGSCITAGGYAIGTVSGGSLNPAVSFSIAMSSLGGGHGIFHVVPYILFEIAGGITAAVAFRITHQEQYSKRNIV